MFPIRFFFSMPQCSKSAIDGDSIQMATIDQKRSSLNLVCAWAIDFPNENLMTMFLKFQFPVQQMNVTVIQLMNVRNRNHLWVSLVHLLNVSMTIVSVQQMNDVHKVPSH